MKRISLLLVTLFVITGCSIDGFQPREEEGVITDFLDGWSGAVTWTISPDWSARVNVVSLSGIIEDSTPVREGYFCDLPAACGPYPVGSPGKPRQADNCTMWSTVEITNPEGQAVAGVYLIQGFFPSPGWALYVNSVSPSYNGPNAELIKRVNVEGSYSIE